MQRLALLLVFVMAGLSAGQWIRYSATGPLIAFKPTAEQAREATGRHLAQQGFTRDERGEWIAPTCDPNVEPAPDAPPTP
jgi:hypothetical protein